MLFALARRRRQFSQKHGDGLSGKLRAVKGRRRKPAEGGGKRFGGDATGFHWRAAAELFGQERTARNGRSAAPAQKAGFGDAAGFEAGEESEDVTANRIRDFHGCGGITELAGVSRIAEVIENGFGEHFSLPSPHTDIPAQLRCSFVRARGDASDRKYRAWIKDMTSIATPTLSLAEDISSQ